MQLGAYELEGRSCKGQLPPEPMGDHLFFALFAGVNDLYHLIIDTDFPKSVALSLSILASCQF